MQTRGLRTKGLYQVTKIVGLHLLFLCREGVLEGWLKSVINETLIQMIYIS